MTWCMNCDPNKLRVRCSPEPEELRENSSNEAVNEDVRPHQLAGKLKGLEARVVEQEEARPQQQQVEQTHKPWETHRSSSSDVSKAAFCQPQRWQLHGIKTALLCRCRDVFVHRRAANMAKNIVGDWNNCDNWCIFKKETYKLSICSPKNMGMSSLSSRSTLLLIITM